MKWLIRKLFRIPKRAGGERIPMPAPNRDLVMMKVSDGYYFPEGNDPYGPHFGDGDCAINRRTGECERDHPGPHKRLPVVGI